ncbi:hypothetical protein M3Y96_00053100 [Aphelenchoides besseyi]|nr:hypothetical protein M3Y96_00053100 [Aphelenchoides besseyi]
MNLRLLLVFEGLLLYTTAIHDPREWRLQNVRQLTFNENITNPTFSRDGRYLIYTTTQLVNGSSCGQIYLLDLKTPKRRPFRLSSGIGHYDWATFHPNGQSIFVSTNFHHFLPLGQTPINATCISEGRKHNSNIFELNLYGNIRRQKTFRNRTLSQLAFSRDGQLLTYVSHETHETSDIWLMNTTDASDKRRLSTIVGYFEYPHFSTDGTKLLFTGTFDNPKEFNFSVYTIDVDGSQLKEVVASSLNPQRPSFHLNNSAVLFTSTTKGPSNLFLANLSHRKTLEQITCIGNNEAYSFSFDGKQIVWSSDRNSTNGDHHDLFIANWVDSDEFEEVKTNGVKDDIPNSSRDFMSWLDKNENFGTKHFPEERHFENVRQLTFGGQNAEGYFSSDGKSMVFQAAGQERYGTQCDQIYTLPIDQEVKSDTLIQRLSTGLGVCTCSFLFPDGKTSIHASTFAAVRPDQLPNSCPIKKCQSPEAKSDPILKNLCNTSYTWDIFPDYDIYKVNQYGNIIQRLTDSSGAISPDGKHIVFTSIRSGDLELWLMDSDGKNLKQVIRIVETYAVNLTNATGYDGGPFFSNDGTKIGFRASRPKTEKEIEKYKQLLSYDLVSPLEMELFTINIDGSGLKKITQLGGSNWAPYYLTDNRHLIFSTNFNATHFGAFDLYTVNEEGKDVERITYNKGGFDAFPMQSHDGKQLIWGSSRNGRSPYDLNLFLADWKN